MASLRKFPRSPYYYACFKLPDGRRVQRSTKEKGRKEAMKKADEWEELAMEKAKARQAQTVIRDIYKAAHGKDLPDSTPAEYFPRWLARKKGEVSPATFTAYEARSRHFLEWLGDRGQEPLAELETEDCARYRDALAERIAPTTCNHAVKILRVLFEDARRDGLVADNPAKDVRPLKKSAKEKRPFTGDELRAVLAVADDEWRSMILFGLYTGQRLKDMAALTWRNIDTEAGEVRIRTGKTGRTVVIPIMAPLARHIADLPAGDSPGEPIHPRSSSTRGSTLSQQFGKLLGEAGLRKATANHEASKEGRDKRRDLDSLTYHSLRHNFTSMLKSAGVSDAVAMDIVGHESKAVSTIYTHLDSDTKRKAMMKVPDILGSES